MICDIFDNIENYARLGEINDSLKYLKSLDPKTPLGEYKISEKSKLIVSEYNSLVEIPKLFEMHLKYIDIQYPVLEEEKVHWIPVQNAILKKSYDPEIDRAYYSAENGYESLTMGKGRFCIFFPEDIHRPCLSTNGSIYSIRKWTIKVLTESNEVTK